MDFDFITYMSDVAEKLKEIQHSLQNRRFHRVSSIANIEELLSNMGNTEGLQLLVVDAYDGRFIDNNSSNLLDSRLFTFYVVKNIQEATDFDEKQEALKQCRLVSKKILSKLFLDKLTDSQAKTETGLRNLDRQSVRYLTVGPIGDNYHGIETIFTILEKPGIIFSEEDWLS